MNEPYLFEKAIGHQMGDLCRLALGDAQVTQTGEIVTLDDILGTGSFSGVSVDVPFTEGGVQSLSVTRCGKNLLGTPVISSLPHFMEYDAERQIWSVTRTANNTYGALLTNYLCTGIQTLSVFFIRGWYSDKGIQIGSYLLDPAAWGAGPVSVPVQTNLANMTLTKTSTVTRYSNRLMVTNSASMERLEQIDFYAQIELGDTATAYEPYNGDTYTITLPADFYGGTIDLTAGTVISLYAQDGSLLPEPVVSDIDPVTIPALAGVNNLWADVGTMTVSYYRADVEKFRPALWYPTIYHGLQSARYLIKSASGAVASFSDAIAAPLVGLRVALPWRSEGYQAVQVGSIGYDRTTKFGGIQYAVDSGDAASKYPVGTEIEDAWGEYTAPWTVVNHYANGNMALQWKYTVPDAVPFDAPEAAYYADATGLATGTYHIAIGSNYGNGWSTSKHIQFTLTRAMVEGDQLVIDLAQSNATDPTASRTWRVYHEGGTEVLETGTTSDGTDGTLLGTIGAESAQRPNGQLNAISRAVYGYSRWSQSAVRQYYNSAAVRGGWWTAQNGWDRPPTQATTVDGFLRGCSEEFLAILEPVEVVTALNTVEGHTTDRETTLDRIFLPSLQELHVNPQLSGAEGEDWDYYKTLSAEAGFAGKFPTGQPIEVLKKYSLASPASAVIVWLRSANRDFATYPWFVSWSGSVNGNSACVASRGCPACIIKKSDGVAKEVVPLPTTIYGGYLDAVTGQLVATHDANGNLLTNQKLYFLPPVNIDTLAGVNNVWSDAGDVAVSYRIDNG